VTQQRLPAPADGLSDAAPSSDGDASPDGDSGSKPRSQKAQRPAFSVSAVAFADDPADSRPGSAPSSPGSSAPGFDVYIRSQAGGTRSGDDAADTLSVSLQSLSAPSHLSNESQTALAQEAALTPALQNSLASLSRSPAGGSRLMPSALYRAPGGLGSHSSQAGSPALSQVGDEPHHREGPPDQPEEEEELSLAALPLKRPAPDHSSGSVGTGEDSSEVTFGAGVGGGGGAESRLRPVPDPVDQGLEAQSAPLPAQLPPADAPSQQVRTGLIICTVHDTCCSKTAQLALRGTSCTTHRAPRLVELCCFHVIYAASCSWTDSRRKIQQPTAAGCACRYQRQSAPHRAPAAPAALTASAGEALRTSMAPPQALASTMQLRTRCSAARLRAAPPRCWAECCAVAERYCLL